MVNRILQYQAKRLTFATLKASVDLKELNLQCLASWLRTGDVDINMVEEHHLIDFAFACLHVEDLFEEGVNAVGDIIYETRDVWEYQHIIANICKHLTEQLPRLKQARGRRMKLSKDIVECSPRLARPTYHLLLHTPTNSPFCSKELASVQPVKTWML